MTRIVAKRTVQTGFSPDEGAKLAAVVMRRAALPRTTHGMIEVDLRGCDPGLVISAFVNGFLQAVVDKLGNEGLEGARRIEFVTDFDWQREDIASWLLEFKPDSVDVA
jgi:hypothetical protein